MQVLLDTHVFLWWIDNNPQLSAHARTIISDSSNQLFVSTVSSWEIAIKSQTGKLGLPTNLEQFITDQIQRNGMSVMPIQLAHTLAIYRLPLIHRDPFDRMLVAQSQSEDVPILTVDPLITQYAVKTLW